MNTSVILCVYIVRVFLDLKISETQQAIVWNAATIKLFLRMQIILLHWLYLDGKNKCYKVSALSEELTIFFVETKDMFWAFSLRLPQEIYLSSDLPRSLWKMML